MPKFFNSTQRSTEVSYSEFAREILLSYFIQHEPVNSSGQGMNTESEDKRSRSIGSKGTKIYKFKIRIISKVVVSRIVL